MRVKRTYHRPFSVGDGKIYPPGEYYYTRGRFSLTLQNKPPVGPFLSQDWNNLETLCMPRIEYQSRGSR
jgi:hypothetical protein